MQSHVVSGEKDSENLRKKKFIYAKLFLPRDQGREFCCDGSRTDKEAVIVTCKGQ